MILQPAGRRRLPNLEELLRRLGATLADVAVSPRSARLASVASNLSLPELQQCVGVASDFIILPRGQDQRSARRRIGADRVAPGEVARLLEAQADPGEARAYAGAHGGVLFADPAGEDDRIDAFERRNHSRDLLARGVAEHFDSEPRILVRGGRFVQPPPVAADARNPDEARAAIDQPSDPRRAGLPLAPPI